MQLSINLPEDCQLVSLTNCGAAWGVSERVARDIVREENIRIVELGPLTHGVRLSDVRKVLERRQRAR
jgi:hypothetical protein